MSCHVASMVAVDKGEERHATGEELSPHNTRHAPRDTLSLSTLSLSISWWL